MVCCRVKKEECFETGEGPVETTLGDFAWRLTKKGERDSQCKQRVLEKLRRSLMS